MFPKQQKGPARINTLPIPITYLSLSFQYYHDYDYKIVVFVCVCCCCGFSLGSFLFLLWFAKATQYAVYVYMYCMYVYDDILYIPQTENCVNPFTGSILPTFRGWEHLPKTTTINASSDLFRTLIAGTGTIFLWTFSCPSLGFEFIKALQTLLDKRLPTGTVHTLALSNKYYSVCSAALNIPVPTAWGYNTADFKIILNLKLVLHII